MAIDHPLMQRPAHLAHPVIDVDFGTTQAQRRFTTHGDQMLTLTTLEAAVFHIADLVGITTDEHLGYEAVIVGGLVAGIGVFKGGGLG